MDGRLGLPGSWRLVLRSGRLVVVGGAQWDLHQLQAVGFLVTFLPGRVQLRVLGSVELFKFVSCLGDNLGAAPALVRPTTGQPPVLAVQRGVARLLTIGSLPPYLPLVLLLRDEPLSVLGQSPVTEAVEEAALTVREVGVAPHQPGVITRLLGLHQI